MTFHTAAAQVAFGEPIGQGWNEVAGFGIAFVLSALIGLERELKQKAAGVRTYTIVGLGSALFVLVSKYGFTDVLVEGRVVLDPSRVAAQIVSGLGFIGGGIIFVKRDAVRGLTTAASIWLTAAVGAAAAGGLPVLAALGTAFYFLAILVLPGLARFVGRHVGTDRPRLRVSYLDGRGLLRDILQSVTNAGFSVAELAATPRAHATNGEETEPAPPDASMVQERIVEISMLLFGPRGDLDRLRHVLSDIEGVVSVTAGGESED
jgi:putative Mg2+ transporter-C (MgtC) family protein